MLLQISIHLKKAYDEVAHDETTFGNGKIERREKIQRTEAKEIRGEDILQLLFIFLHQRQFYL